MFEGYVLPSTPEAMELMGDLWADPHVTLGMKVAGLLAGFFVALMTLSKSARASFKATQVTIYGFAHIFTRMFEKDPHIKSLLYALDDPDMQVEGELGKDAIIKLKTCRGLVVELSAPNGIFNKDTTKLLVGADDDWGDLTAKERDLIYKKVMKARRRALERDRLVRRIARSNHIEGAPVENFVVVNSANMASNVPVLAKYNPTPNKKRA